MTSYDDFRTIVESSNEELQAIARFLKSREVVTSPITVLIGGWAVHSYNPWYGSIDIDLITNARTRNSLKNHLVKNRGFVRARNLDDTKRVEKLAPSGMISWMDEPSPEILVAIFTSPCRSGRSCPC